MDELAALASLEPLAGGWSGQTFLGRVGTTEVVVRIYTNASERGELAHEVDAALLALVRGLLPVARVLEVRRGDPTTGTPALLVTERLRGVRLDLAQPEADEAARRVLGRRLGELAADLAGMPLLRAGMFVDAELTVREFPADGLPAFVEAYRPRLAHLSATELDSLLGLAHLAQAELDTVDRVCLVHGDLNPKNLLVDPETWEITGLVDWEYAHAGHPYTDLGNLLRFERDPVLVRAVLGAWSRRHGIGAREALSLARAADLFALVDLAARRGQSPVADRVDALLRATLAVPVGTRWRADRLP